MKVRVINNQKLPGESFNWMQMEHHKIKVGDIYEIEIVKRYRTIKLVGLLYFHPVEKFEAYPKRLMKVLSLNKLL